MQQSEKIQKILLLRPLVENGLDDGVAGVLDGRERIGDDENPERGAAEDQEFERLHKRVQMAAERGIASEHAAKRNDQSDDEIQWSSPLAQAA